MMVSLAFSFVIYRAATFELNRFARAQQNRFAMRPNPPPFDDDLLDDAQDRLVKTLILINLGILLSAGVLGYYLSGKTLEPISEMIDEQYRFVSDASHELKTPLTAIKTTLEVALRDKNLKIDEARKTIGIGLEEVNRLSKLAEGLLELSHKNVTQVIVPTNIADILSSVKKTLDPIAKNIGVEIVIIKSQKIVVEIDPSNMERAMIAIVDNAIKYSPAKSKIGITAKIAKSKILVKVADTGIGIEQTELTKIFDRFYRSDKSRCTSGYGLGLSIAKQIVQGNGGTIEIDSKIGKGTTVLIALPYSAKLQKANI
jgi:signal transduction histidine kinase